MRKKFDVAFSYAGEDRAYVERVADECLRRGVKVFYDRALTDELWGRDLDTHLPDVYESSASYVVVFLSSHYVRKAWPQRELAAAVKSRELLGLDYVLPARFDDSVAGPLPSSLADVDLRRIEPEDFARIIASKVEKHRASEEVIERVLSGTWTNEGNVFPPDTHSVELELTIDGLGVTGTLSSSQRETGSSTGLASVDGTRAQGRLLLDISTVSYRGSVDYGQVRLALILGHDNTPTQLRWERVRRSQPALDECVPQETTLYPLTRS